jgi:hypothetical protein
MMLRSAQTIRGHPPVRPVSPPRALTADANITPLEGGWARLESFSGRGYGQTLGW